MEPRATRQNKRPLSLFSSRVSLLFLFSLGGLPFTPFAKGGSALPLLAEWPTLYSVCKGWVPSSPHLCDASASVPPQNRRVPAWSTPNNSSPISFSAPSHAPVISTGLNDSSRFSLSGWPPIALVPPESRVRGMPNHSSRSSPAPEARHKLAQCVSAG